MWLLHQFIDPLITLSGEKSQSNLRYAITCQNISRHWPPIKWADLGRRPLWRRRASERLLIRHVRAAVASSTVRMLSCGLSQDGEGKRKCKRVWPIGQIDHHVAVKCRACCNTNHVSLRLDLLSTATVCSRAHSSTVMLPRALLTSIVDASHI